VITDHTISLWIMFNRF